MITKEEKMRKRLQSKIKRLRSHYWLVAGLGRDRISKKGNTLDWIFF
jgi:hypothetical protein